MFHNFRPKADCGTTVEHLWNIKNVVIKPFIYICTTVPQVPQKNRVPLGKIFCVRFVLHTLFFFIYRAKNCGTCGTVEHCLKNGVRTPKIVFHKCSTITKFVFHIVEHTNFWASLLEFKSGTHQKFCGTFSCLSQCVNSLGDMGVRGKRGQRFDDLKSL